MHATGLRLFLCACAASLSCAQPAAAQPPAASVTVAGWTIRDRLSHCSADTRQGGNLFVEIVHHASFDHTTMLVGHASWAALRERHGDGAGLRFSNGRSYNGVIIDGARADAGVTTVGARSDGGDLLEDFARAHSVVILIGGTRAGTLSLQGTRAVAERLRSCAAASARRNPPPVLAPPPFHRPQPPGPTPPIHRSGSIGDADYPASALRAEEQGTVLMRLTVSGDGRVTACTITGSSGSAVLDSTSCSLAQRRFRFTPARDASGNSVEGTATRAIRWSLPSRAPEPQAPVPPK